MAFLRRKARAIIAIRKTSAESLKKRLKKRDKIKKTCYNVFRKTRSLYGRGARKRREESPGSTGQGA